MTADPRRPGGGAGCEFRPMLQGGRVTPDAVTGTVLLGSRRHAVPLSPARRWHLWAWLPWSFVGFPWGPLSPCLGPGRTEDGWARPSGSGAHRDPDCGPRFSPLNDDRGFSCRPLHPTAESDLGEGLGRSHRGPGSEPPAPAPRGHSVSQGPGPTPGPRLHRAWCWAPAFSPLARWPVTPREAPFRFREKGVEAQGA